MVSPSVFNSSDSAVLEQGPVLTRRCARIAAIDCSAKIKISETVSRWSSFLTYTRICYISKFSMVFKNDSTTVLVSMSPWEPSCEASFYAGLSTYDRLATRLSSRKRQRRRMGSSTLGMDAAQGVHATPYVLIFTSKKIQR